MSDAEKWLDETTSALSEEEMRSKWQKALREGEALLTESEFEGAPFSADEMLAALLPELEWYQEKILSDDEGEKWWYCHQVRQNILTVTFTPATRAFMVMALHRCRDRAFEAGDLDKVLLCSFCGALVGGRGALETSSLARGLLRHFRAGAEIPPETTDEVRRSLAVYEEYEQLGEEHDPFLKWALDGEQNPDPNPLRLDEELLDRILELSSAIEGGNPPVALFRQEDMAELYNASGMMYLGFMESDDEAMSQEAYYRVVSKLGGESRRYLGGIHGTEAWEEVRTRLSIAASNCAMSTEADQRRWEQPMRDALATLDHFDRGNHPVLRSVLLQQVMRAHTESMQRMRQTMAEQGVGPQAP